MSSFWLGLLWLLLFLAVPVTVAYRRTDLGTATLATGGALVVYSLAGYGPGFLVPAAVDIVRRFGCTQLHRFSPGKYFSQAI